MIIRINMICAKPVESYDCAINEIEHFCPSRRQGPTLLNYLKLITFSLIE